MAWLTILFCNFCTGILSIILARKKHRAPIPWFLVTLPFGVAALFVLLALPELEGSGIGDQGSDHTTSSPGTSR